MGFGVTGRTLYTLGHAGEPIGWQRIDEHGKLSGEGALEAGERGGAEPGDFVVVSVPGDRVTLKFAELEGCLLYTSPSPRDRQKSRMPSSA